jgi:YYY domain-containing protein
MLIPALSWLVVIELLALVVFPLMRRALPTAVESAFAASKVAGLVLFGVAAWGANWFFHLAFTPKSLWGLLLVLAIMAWVFQRKSGGILALRHDLAQVKRVQCLYLGLFLFFLLLRSLQPEIFWGEKPMDFTLLNALIRLEHLPPQEPWAAGLTLNYYYLGFFIFSLLHKLAAVDSALGFNLAVVTIGAFIGTATLGVLRELGVRASAALWGALAITLLSNWEVWRLFWFEGQKAGFDLFWASSRVFASPAFSEYPLWSVLFADLHAHVMAIPVAVVSLGCSVAGMRYVREGGRLELPLVHGLILGALFGINSWDSVSQGALLLGALVAAILVFHTPPALRCVARAAEYLLIAGLAASLVVVPLRASMGPGPELHFGWVLGEFNSASHVVRYLGLWIVPVGLALVGLTLRLSREARIHYLTFACALVVASVPLLLGQVVSQQLQGQTPSWTLLCGLSAGLFCATIAAACSDLSFTQRAGALLFVAALLIVTTVELVFLMDRMNTIFKFYIPVWFLCGLGFFALLPGLTRNSGCIGRTVVAGSAVLSLLVAAIGTAINLWGMALFHRIERAPRPTLDGMAYHSFQNPDRGYLLQWMRREIHGQPVIIEAFGNSYGPFTRIAMNTGLPTVLGWDHHVSQRGVPQSEIATRRAAVREFYSTTDAQRATQIIDEYRIAFVVLGDVEREAYRTGVYQQQGLQKFSQRTDIFRVVFQSGGEVLYATKFAPALSSGSAAFTE